MRFIEASKPPKYFLSQLQVKQEKEQWKNLLNQLPLGMILAKDGEVEFSNNECHSILENTANIVTADSFKEITSKDGVYSVTDVIKDTTILPSAVTKQYILKGESTTDRHFTLRHSTITFKDHITTAIMLQDQTSFEELKQLDEKYQRLYLASVVHDIRTPLNGILGMLDIIDQYELKEEIKSYIGVARCSAKLLLYLTYDITDYSQIESGMISIVKDNFSPLEVVDETTKLLDFSFRHKGLALKKQIPCDIPQLIVSDKNRYMQIILNLLGNALKFTFRGEIKITLEYDKAEDKLITCVKDTGIGIKEEDLPKLFKLFGKIRENSELNPTGVGLGLAICKKLSEHLGGDISVKSTYGQGSTFTFTIPCGLAHVSQYSESNGEIPVEFTEEKKSELLYMNTSYDFLKVIHRPLRPFAHEQSQVNTTLLEKCECAKLLIVDDNDCNIYVLQSYSKASKLQHDIVSILIIQIIQQARNGQEALDKVKARANKGCCKNYQLILMDINMPVMDGIEATGKIRELELNACLPKAAIIALTAADTSKNVMRDQYTGLGFDTLLGKPTSKKVFEELIKKHIN
eukprot:TRINITY_DN613_c0_g1_i3.p3 TRINITY_DN613_c0_g1~~TRINITY_DN613_c0_g1_i3.p3  ORF type:complete len:575 (-),score=51.54 TRINITY_DN613_c0_g1_i3:8023-9747(-)